jgi:hypothetical protein
MSNHRHLVLHVDGSKIVPKGDGKGQGQGLSAGRGLHSFGWGVVALHDDTHTERFGHFMSRWDSGLNGHHEQIAFVQGVLLARELGFAKDWSRVSIFCDDMIFGSAPSHLHKDNFAPSRAQQIHTCLDTVTRLCFDEEAKTLTLEALGAARIVKVKGHSLHVYQERVDHLAKFGARQGAGVVGQDESPQSMEEWLAAGIPTYLENEQAGAYMRTIWRAPFVADPQDTKKTPGLRV